MSTQSAGDRDHDGDGVPDSRDMDAPDGFDVAAEVAKDLRAGVRNMAERAVDAETSADQYEESARRERALAAEYRAKVVVLREHLTTLGIDPDV